MESETVKQVEVTQTPTGQVETQTITQTDGSISEFFLSKTNQIIFTIVGIIDLLLIVRVFFLLFGATNRVGIVNFIIELTQIFVYPFTGVFNSPSTGSSYLDVAALLAMVTILLFGFIVSSVVKLFSIKNTE